MKVFLSWSGRTSQKMAAIFHDWLPDVIQAAEPFYSTEDIKSGTSWFNRIAQTLDQYQCGIVFVTRQNMNSSWIAFEAGALFKHFGQSSVTPLLFDITPTNLTGPFAQLQAARFDREDVFKILRDMNRRNGDQMLPEERLQKAFGRQWTDLESQVREVLEQEQGAASNQEPQRSVQDLLGEVLELTRSMSRRLPETSTEPLLTRREVIGAWPRVLEEIRHKFKRTAALMANARPVDVRGLLVIITFNERLPDLEKANLVQLTELVRRRLALVLGLDGVQVRLALEAPSGTKMFLPGATEPAPPRKLTQARLYALEDPFVQEALSIFGGEVIDD